MIHHVPNILSLTRLVLTPVLLALLLRQTPSADVLAFCVFAAASFSDWLDGRVARAYKARTRVGQFLDPLADKVLILGTLLVLPVVVPVIPFWAVTIIAVRDVAVTLLRIWGERNGKPLVTSYLAKVKTTIQMVFVTWVVLLLVLQHASDPFGVWAKEALAGPTLFALLMIVLGLTLYTGFGYLRDFTSGPSIEETQLHD